MAREPKVEGKRVGRVMVAEQKNLALGKPGRVEKLVQRRFVVLAARENVVVPAAAPGMAVETGQELALSEPARPVRG